VENIDAKALRELALRTDRRAKFSPRYAIRS
jgi:hypothetical protein